MFLSRRTTRTEPENSTLARNKPIRAFNRVVFIKWVNDASGRHYQLPPQRTIAELFQPPSELGKKALVLETQNAFTCGHVLRPRAPLDCGCARYASF